MDADKAGDPRSAVALRLAQVLVKEPPGACQLPCRAHQGHAQGVVAFRTDHCPEPAWSAPRVPTQAGPAGLSERATGAVGTRNNWVTVVGRRRPCLDLKVRNLGRPTAHSDGVSASQALHALTPAWHRGSVDNNDTDVTSAGVGPSAPTTPAANVRQSPFGLAPPLLLRQSEVADHLRVDRKSVQRLVAAGELATVSWGRTTRIPWSELLAFVERHQD